MSITINHANAILLGSDQYRILGMPVHERNTRVLTRMGIEVLESADLASASYLLVIPNMSVIEVSLKDALTDTTSPVQLTSGDGSWAVWGPTHAIMSMFTLDETGAWALTSSEVPSTEISADDALFNVSTPITRQRTGRILLKHCEKETDGWVSRNFNRPMSRFFSYWFLNGRVTPLFASGINLAIGLLCAWFIAQPGWLSMVIAGVLFQFTSMFDGVDGEMARVTLTESKRGAAIDTAIDVTTYLACLVALMFGWYHEIHNHWMRLGGAVLIIGIPLTLLQVQRFVSQHGTDASFVFFDRCVQRAARNSNSQMLEFTSTLFHTTRRDLFAFIFFILSWFGYRAIYPALLGFGLVMTNYVLIVHRTKLVAAARSLQQ